MLYIIRHEPWPSFGMYYDKNGKPLSMEEWGILFGDPEYKVVASSEINGVHISTVWLGLDHSFGRTPEPMIFETMIFGGDLDGYQVRCAYEWEAMLNHEDAIYKVEMAAL